MTKEELGKKIYEVSHITGEFKLRSGDISNEYFDKYQFEARPNILTQIAKHLQSEFLTKLEFDFLAGLEMGGIPIATAVALDSNYDMVFVRKNAKEYGTSKLAEGPDIEGKKLLIVEDVVTSGGQIKISTNDLRERGAIVEDAVCIINREAGGEENLAESGLKLHSLFRMSELKVFGA